jgi:hypothetical protein
MAAKIQRGRGYRIGLTMVCDFKCMYGILLYYLSTFVLCIIFSVLFFILMYWAHNCLQIVLLSTFIVCTILMGYTSSYVI